jgi:glutathione S-transferase
MVEMKTLQQEPFTKLNPNGRVPVIEDENTNVKL